MTFGNSLKLGFAEIGNSMKVNSPDILTGLGVLSIVGGLVLACRNTLKLAEVIEDHNDALEKIEELRGTNGYSDKEANEDVRTVCLNTGIEVAKAYAPVIALETFGIGSVLYSHKIMKDRYFGALSTINGMQLAYNAYRERVKKEVGEEKEYDIFHNIKRELVEEEYTDDKGKKKKRMVEKKVDMGEKGGRFSYFYDGNFWGFKDMLSNASNMKQFEKNFNQQLYQRGMDSGFSTFTLKEVTDFFNWSKDEKRQSDLLTNGWIFTRKEFEDGVYDKYSDGTPRIIKLITSPDFGVTEAETWVDLNCRPIIAATRAYEEEINERNRRFLSRSSVA